MIRSRTSFHVLNQASFLVLYRPATRAGLVHGLSWIGLAAPATPWLRVTEVVLAERKLMTYAHAIVKQPIGGLSQLVSERVPAILFYSFAASATIFIEEDCEASLTFWGMEPCIFDGTQGAATLAEWLHDLEILFRLCHIEARLQVMLASRRLVEEACAWWLNIGNPEGPHMHYRDPEIYHNMYMRRYVSNVVDWRAYPNESMSHYCKQFRDAMLPYIP
ncbi:hypothetical protein TIFTF001_044745 [Ficus carica]|uniref:Uncharacterized protein n=1 Tax=Ficus carica TaxID=3494 RepID=A0AA88CWB9_FICCA|nr:hypothetical protein TIFTF001_044745 [Ficus carica]